MVKKQTGQFNESLHEEHLKDLRRKRRKFRVDRFRKTWSLFYRNGFGKAGFYLLLFFIVITILSPVIITHRDSYTYIAPQIDTTTPALLASNYAGNLSADQQLSVPSMGSSTSFLGSNYVYTLNARGQIKAMSLQTSYTSTKGQMFNVANVSIGDSVPVAVSIFSMVQYFGEFTGAQTLAHYFMVATSSGTINLTSVVSHNINGRAIPPYAVSSQSITLKNSTFVIPPVSSVSPLDQSKFPQFMPFYSFSSSLYGSASNVGRIFDVTRSTTNSSYYLTEILDSGMTVAWSKKLSLSSPPTGLQIYGSFFTQSRSQLVVMTDGSSILAYQMNGSLAWQSNLTGSLFTGNMHVPQDYQLSPNSYNFILAVANNTSSSNLYAVSASNGTFSSVFQSSSPDMTAVSSTPGSSGFPTNVVAIAGKDIYMLNGPNNVIRKISVPSGAANQQYNPIYDSEFGTFIVSSSNGELYSLSSSPGTYPFTWGIQLPASVNTISRPSLVQDADTGQGAITFTAGNGYIYVYSMHGKSLNPMPPTFRTPTGNIFPLGTNVIGNDVWSQFISGFTSDWTVAGLVGMISMSLAIVFGILIGYYRGLVSNTVETISLSIFLIPGIALLIAVTSVVKASLVNVALILSFTGWPFITFTILGVMRTLKERTFIEAARVSGAGSIQIIRKHIMPNLLPLLAYLTAVTTGGAVGAVSALQFLQLVPSVTLQTWGSMLWLLYYNYLLAASSPWWILPPTLALTFFLMAFIFISRGIDAVANPRLKR